MITKFKAIIFDLDGTLLDTLGDLEVSLNFALKAYKLPLQSREQINLNIGKGLKYLVSKSVEGGENYLYFSSLFSLFKRHYSANCCNKTRPYDGIIPVLKQLKSAGIKSAVITNKLEPNARTICAKYFPGLLNAAFGETALLPRKPAPDIVFKALAAIKTPAASALMFGDSETDEQTAVNAGLSHYAVLWGYRTKQQLMAEGAKHFISRPEEIISLVL